MVWEACVSVSRPECLGTGRCWSMELGNTVVALTQHKLPPLQATPMCSLVLGEQRPTWISRVKVSLTRVSSCAGSRGKKTISLPLPVPGGHLLFLACDPSIFIIEFNGSIKTVPHISQCLSNSSHLVSLQDVHTHTHTKPMALKKITVFF